MAISLQINTALKLYDTSKETCVIYVNLNIHMTSITVFGHDQRLYISYTNYEPRSCEMKADCFSI